MRCDDYCPSHSAFKFSKCNKFLPGTSSTADVFANGPAPGAASVSAPPEGAIELLRFDRAARLISQQLASSTNKTYESARRRFATEVIDTVTATSGSAV